MKSPGSVWPPSLLAALALALLAPASRAGDSVEFGSFTREELFSMHFAEHPGADAVVLYDHGELTVDPKFHLRHRRHLRTKILTADGAAHAEVRILEPEGAKVRDIRAHTVVPPNRFVKLEKRHITEEKTPEGKLLVLRFPDVAPGVILEVSYERWTREIARLDPWVFQNDVPTRLSRLDLRVPDGLRHHAEFGWVPGMIPVPEKSVVNDDDDPDRQLRQTRWTLRDLPPFREVPLLPNPVDYRTTLFLQLTRFESPVKPFPIAPGWDRLAASVAENWERAAAADEGVATWVGDAGTPEELFRRLRDGIEPEEQGSPFSPRSCAQVVAAGRGSRAERNLLLAKLLRDRGQAARGILVRPVGRGEFRPKWQSLDQLETVITRLETADGALLLDASPGRCFGRVGPDLRVARGLAPAESSHVVELSHPAVESHGVVATRARLLSDGTLVGATRWTFSGFEALPAREALARQDAASYAAARIGRVWSGAVLDSVRVEPGAEEDGELVVTASFRAPSWAEVSQRGLVCPIPYLLGAESPSPDPARRYPIHLGLLRSHDEAVEITFPDGHRVRQAPAEARETAGDVSYSLAVQRTQSSVSLRRRLSVRSAWADESTAPEQARFWSAVRRADRHPVQSALRPEFSGSR